MKKTAYWYYSEEEHGEIVLLSHCLFPYEKHSITKDGIPYLKRGDKDIKLLSSEYEIKLYTSPKRPAHRTIRTIQANIYEEAIMQFIGYLLKLGQWREMNKIAWLKAIRIYVGCFNMKYLEVHDENLYEYMNLTADQIYYKLR